MKEIVKEEIMYYCTTCGAVFDEPGVEYQMHAFGDGYASEPRSCCPKCAAIMRRLSESARTVRK